jgi:hypothetical protein
MPELRNMIGKEVEIFASGVRYTGTLIEVSDTEVNLKGPLQWITLPVSSVGEIKLKEVERVKPDQDAAGE